MIDPLNGVEKRLRETELNFIRLDERLQNHIKTISESIEKSERLLAAQLTKTEVALEVKLTEMNKIREQLGVQRDEFIPKDVFSVFVDSYNKDIRDLRTFKDESKGMASQKSVNFTMVISIVATIIGILNYIGK